MKVGTTVALATLAIVLTSAVAAYGQQGGGVQAGNDVSYPQCGITLPTGQAFGIVAVNDGLANTTNPCLAAEIAWAQTSTGAARQPRASLYVNTADPGSRGSPTGRRLTTTRSTATASLIRTVAARAGTVRRAPGSTGGTWPTLMCRRAGCRVPAATCGGSMSRRSTPGSPAPGRTALTWRAWPPTSGTSAPEWAFTRRPSSGTRSWEPSRAPARCTGCPIGYRAPRRSAQAEKNCRAAPLTGGGTISVTQWKTSPTSSDLSCRALPQKKA